MHEISGIAHGHCLSRLVAARVNLDLLLGYRDRPPRNLLVRFVLAELHALSNDRILFRGVKILNLLPLNGDLSSHLTIERDLIARGPHQVTSEFVAVSEDEDVRFRLGIAFRLPIQTRLPPLARLQKETSVA